MTLPWSRDFFACLADKPTPIIGHMPHYEVRKLQTQIAYLQQRLACQVEPAGAISQSGDA